MKNNILRQAALLVTAVLLTTNFWSCSKDEEPVPEPSSPQTTLTIKVLHARHPKRNPFLRPFWVLSFYLRENNLRKKAATAVNTFVFRRKKKATANSTKIPKM